METYNIDPPSKEASEGFFYRQQCLFMAATSTGQRNTCIQPHGLVAERGRQRLFVIYGHLVSLPPSPLKTDIAKAPELRGLGRFMIWLWVRMDESGGGRSLGRTRLRRFSLLNREFAGKIFGLTYFFIYLLSQCCRNPGRK
jgi:hypothetical protein